MIVGLTAPPRRYSQVARVIAIGIAFIFGSLSYRLPYSMPTDFGWWWVAMGLSGLLVVLVYHDKNGSAQRPASSHQKNRPVCHSPLDGNLSINTKMPIPLSPNHLRWLLLFSLSFLVHATIASILESHFPDWRLEAPGMQRDLLIAMNYWLLVMVGVGLLRYFSHSQAKYFLYEATLVPLVRGIWRTRILEYGLYLLSMSQIVFYAFCLSSIGIVILRLLSMSQLINLDLDAWYFTGILIGFLLLILRKVKWRSVWVSALRFGLDIRYILLLFGLILLAFLATPIALSDWLKLKGWYTIFHHEHLSQMTWAIKNELEAGTFRREYLIAGLWLVCLPWIISLYYRLSIGRPFGIVVLGVLGSTLLCECLLAQYPLSLGKMACILLLIQVGFTFRNQTNQLRFVGAWLPHTMGTRIVKIRHCRDEMARLARFTILLSLMSIIGFWPLMQLQVFYYALGVLLVWTVISISYLKESCSKRKLLCQQPMSV